MKRQTTNCIPGLNTATEINNNVEDNIFVDSMTKILSMTVSYLGFQKKRGPNFRWPLVLPQRGAKLSFLNFSYGENKFFYQKKQGYGSMAPLNTPLINDFFIDKIVKIRPNIASPLDGSRNISTYLQRTPG